MYKPAPFHETRVDVMHALIRQHRLGTVVVQRAGGLAADHLPFLLAPPAPGRPQGTLLAHVARANPLRDLDGAPVLVVFQGPSAYVSPALYDEHQASGKVVPTWNYAAVHVHGQMHTFSDRARLLPLLEALTERHEAGRAAPWSMAAAPEQFIERLLGEIVGVEIVIAALEGKWKASQNRTAADRARIAEQVDGMGELMGHPAWNREPAGACPAAPGAAAPGAATPGAP